MLMLELLGLIALIAIIFGISFGAALHGMLMFVGIGVVIAIILSIIGTYMESTSVRTPTMQAPKTVNRPIQVPQKPTNKKPSKHGDLFVWVCLFIASYCITVIVLAICGYRAFFWEPYWLSGLLSLAIPTIPFDIYLAYHIIKKRVGNKNRHVS